MARRVAAVRRVLSDSEARALRMFYEGWTCSAIDKFEGKKYGWSRDIITSWWRFNKVNGTSLEKYLRRAV